MMYRGARCGFVVFALALLFCPGCGDGSVDRLRTELSAARDRWAEAGISSYAITQRRSCFCPSPASWTVVISNGQPLFIESVESWSSATTATTATEGLRALEREALELSMTVEELFDWIERRIGNVAEMDFVFDAALGFPTSVDVDEIANAIDDEISWTLSNLIPTGPCTEIGCEDALTVSLSSAGGRFAPGEYVVSATPVAGTGASCSFTVVSGGTCPAEICVQDTDCAILLTEPIRILVTLPVLDGVLELTVTVDGSTVTTESVEPIYARRQPNGALCPPVCWTGEQRVDLP